LNIVIVIKAVFVFVDVFFIRADPCAIPYSLEKEILSMLNDLSLVCEDGFGAVFFFHTNLPETLVQMKVEPLCLKDAPAGEHFWPSFMVAAMAGGNAKIEMRRLPTTSNLTFFT
jgi:hypothetical protein